MGNLEFDSVCRLCVNITETDEVCSIFQNDTSNNKISLPEKIKYCLPIEVADDDGLPPNICNNCMSKLNQSFMFRNQCVLADITLKHWKKVSCNLNDIPNLSKVNLENQIILAEKDFCEHVKSILLPVQKKETKDDVYSDNLDKSETENFEKTLKKTEKTLEKLKFVNLTTKNNNDLNEKILQNSVFESPTKRKINCKIKESVRKKIIRNETQFKIKKPKFFKNKKEAINTEESEEKVTAGFLKTDHKNDVTVSFNFTEDKVENNLNTNIKQSTEIQPKAVSKSSKSKPLELKKVKTNKKGTAKEKPSSYTCEYCKKVYPSEGGWRYHIHTIHNENYQPFICDLCGQAFKVKKNLEGHKNSIHFHIKPHLCDLCGRGFASKYALKVHKIWHSDEKNFSCDICGTKFRTRGKMNTHRSIHGGPKKFMCHICSREFRWKKDFEIHMRTHTGEKPFKCLHCGKAFASLANKKKHERNHTGKVEVGKDAEVSGIIGPNVDDKQSKTEFTTKRSYLFVLGSTPRKSRHFPERFANYNSCWHHQRNVKID